MIFSKVLVALVTFSFVQLAQAKLPTSSIDCDDEDNRKDAMCICRLQSNHHMPICKEFVDQNNDGVNQQIINGEEVEPNIHPWFARSTLGSGWAGCGGSLVTPEYVLTAAHCVDGRESNLENNGGYQIGALCAPYGPNESNNCGQAVQSFGISDIIPHPNYNSNSVQNDFALVRLDGSSTITPVTMDPGDISPSYENLSLKENLWPIGFGTDENGSVTSKLMRVNVNYVKDSTCNENYNGGIFENMMCAADTNEDSCQGDSGGPLYDSDNDVLVGVVSWGIGCAQAGYPGVYSRISNQISWIKEEICKSGAHNEPRPSFCGPAPPTPAPTPAPPTPAPTPCTTPSIEVEVTTDNYPAETSWEITNSCNNGVVGSGGDYTEANTIQTYSLCVPQAQYTFVISDAFGDGICCSYGEGSYKVEYGDEVREGAEFGSEESHTLGSCDNDPTSAPVEPTSAP
eukprot:CAMPEP_0194194308 /NCGR_PEP_ID=MMETSP0154-20130528/75515_1 /TAXON_ID=1049557 /ORGANISM="Thalassiothrix antarctica, Strain L6-D1" /LENGTH=456 /DNA_ID=CAMNT_0038918729 /DNA_START=70 /DNA_END=1436 /DNA_ORIENTATION=+